MATVTPRRSSRDRSASLQTKYHVEPARRATGRRPDPALRITTGLRSDRRPLRRFGDPMGGGQTDLIHLPQAAVAKALCPASTGVTGRAIQARPTPRTARGTAMTTGTPDDDNDADPTVDRQSLLIAGIASADPMVRSTFMTTAGVIMDALILAVDLSLPAHYATAILYTVPVLTAFWLPSPRATMALAVIGTFCSVVGYAMSPVGPAAGPVEMVVYRVAGLVVLWAIAVLAIRHQSARFSAERSMIARRHQAALLQAILDTTPDALIVINQDGIIQSFSRSAEILFGYRAGEIVGRNVSRLMPGGDRKRHDGYLSHYIRTGERRIIGIGRVVDAETRDGRIIPIELAVGEARVANHRVFIGFIRDLSARRRIEEELRQAQKMEAIGQLTGGIAHDFNNLLTVITGNLELLEAHKNVGDPIALREALEAAEMGASLTHQLLSFGRRQPLDPKNIDVAALVENVAGLLRRTMGDHIELVVNNQANAGKAVVDASQLQTALLNLAINARDAMPGGGRLTVTVFGATLDAIYAEVYPEVRLGRYVAIQVADSGTGMTPEVKSRAFEPFFTTKQQGTGSGLGLSMVYGFAKQSKGHVEIDSTVGHGTTVTLFLPRADTPDERRGEALETQAPEPGAKRDDPRGRRRRAGAARGRQSPHWARLSGPGGDVRHGGAREALGDAEGRSSVH